MLGGRGFILVLARLCLNYKQYSITINYKSAYRLPSLIKEGLGEVILKFINYPALILPLFKGRRDAWHIIQKVIYSARLWLRHPLCLIAQVR